MYHMDGNIPTGFTNSTYRLSKEIRDVEVLRFLAYVPSFVWDFVFKIISAFFEAWVI